MADWARDKAQVWERVCEKYGGSKDAFAMGTWGFFDWSIGKAWPTVSSISKARKFGWTRYDDTFETWVETFRTFGNAGILPKPELVKAATIVESKKVTASNVVDESQPKINGKMNGIEGGSNGTHDVEIDMNKVEG